MRKLAPLMLLIGVMVVLAACYPFGYSSNWATETLPPTPTTPTTPSPTVSTANGTATVIIDNFAYNPATLIVTKGTTVTWTNKYPLAHRVNADGGGFASGNLGTRSSFKWTFNESGNYTYHCENHPSMKG